MTDSPRRRAILELAKAGVKTSDIASSEHVRMEEREVLEELRLVLEGKHPSVDPQSALELERLDTITRAIWKDVVRGDTKAVAQALAVSARRQQIIEGSRGERTPDQGLQDSMDKLLSSVVERSKKYQGTLEEPTEPHTNTQE